MGLLVDRANTLQEHNEGVEVLNPHILLTLVEARNENRRGALKELAEQLSAGQNNGSQHPGGRAANFPAHVIVITVVSIALPVLLNMTYFRFRD